jgi:hypothetical protein
MCLFSFTWGGGIHFVCNHCDYVRNEWPHQRRWVSLVVFLTVFIIVCKWSPRHVWTPTMSENVGDTSRRRRHQKVINVERWCQQCPTTWAPDDTSWMSCAKNLQCTFGHYAVGMVLFEGKHLNVDVHVRVEIRETTIKCVFLPTQHLPIQDCLNRGISFPCGCYWIFCWLDKSFLLLLEQGCRPIGIFSIQSWSSKKFWK